MSIKHCFVYLFFFLAISAAFVACTAKVTPVPETEVKPEEPEVEPPVDEDKEEDQDGGETTPPEEQLPEMVILNAGFEIKNFVDWEKEGTVNNSDKDFHSGSNAAKFDAQYADGSLQQKIGVFPNEAYRLRVYVKGAGQLFVKLDETSEELTAQTPEGGNSNYEPLDLDFQVNEQTHVTIGIRYHEATGRFDDFSIDYASEVEVPEDAKYPTDIIPSLTQWKITLPVDKNGNDSRYASNVDGRNTSPWEIKDNALIDFDYSPYFSVQQGEVIFRGHCAGATTSGSKYPRSELRQRVGGGDNYWSVYKEQYLKTQLRVTHLPVVKPEVCMVQIHGPNDEPLRVQYSESNHGLHIIWNENNRAETNIPYKLGDLIEVEVYVNGGYINCKIRSLENGRTFEKEWESEDKTGYFKVGCYTQSSIFLSEFKSEYDKDEPIDAYGEVSVKSIELKETY